MPEPLRTTRILVWALALGGTLCLCAGLAWFRPGPLTLPGQLLPFSHPSAAVIDPRGRVTVVDAASTRLLALDRDGTLRWTRTASAADQGFSSVLSAGVDALGRLYVADPDRRRVVRFTDTGRFDRVVFSLQVAGEAPGSRLRSFAVTGDAAAILVETHGVLKLYRADLATGNLTLLRLLMVPAGLVEAVADAEGRLLAFDLQRTFWTSALGQPWSAVEPPPGLHPRALGAGVGGTFLVLDGATGDLISFRSPGGPFEAFHSAPPGGHWSPQVGFGGDSARVLVDQVQGSLTQEDPTSSRLVWAGARLSLLDGLAPSLPWALILVGTGGLGACLVLAGRRLLRRAFDVQILQVFLLVPLLIAVETNLFHGIFDQVDRRLTERQALVLREAGVMAAQTLDLSPDLRVGLAAVAATGQKTGAYSYAVLYEPSPRGLRVVTDPAAPWREGLEVLELPPGARNPGPQGPAVLTYEDSRARHRAAFLPWGLPGTGRILEVGTLEDPAGPDQALRNRSLHLVGLVLVTLSVLASLVLGLAGLWSAAPWHGWARDLTARTPGREETLRRFFPRLLREASEGRWADRGTVLVFLWTPAPGPRAFTARAQALASLGLRVRSEGGAVASVWPEGLVILYPRPLEDALPLAQGLRRSFGAHRIAVASGPWSFSVITQTDRRDTVAGGAALDKALALGFWAPGVEMGVIAEASTLEPVPDLVFRGVGVHQGAPVAQVLDPDDAHQRRLLDYLPPHREAFAAWLRGDLDQARRGFAFLKERLPADPVVASLAAEVGL